ncbi:hypothetical protein GOBAR_AA32797 [Gossypium barbadense]|uniref:Uncharacterized protein n=1 Tax=Gossypium barbadense TaxID=3634 RepID=A0A2P5WA31_GOSBA|nr:hypothetical protein GOBAR_AA32797 [Gossypium barbadense]
MRTRDQLRGPAPTWPNQYIDLGRVVTLKEAEINPPGGPLRIGDKGDRPRWRRSRKRSRQIHTGRSGGGRRKRQRSWVGLVLGEKAVGCRLEMMERRLEEGGWRLRKKEVRGKGWCDGGKFEREEKRRMGVKLGEGRGACAWVHGEREW